jgi:hypothetical protein
MKELDYVVAYCNELTHNKILLFVFRDGDEDYLGYCMTNFMVLNLS